MRPCTPYHEHAYSVTAKPPRICCSSDKVYGKKVLSTCFTARLDGRLSEFYLDDMVWGLDHGIAIKRPDAIFIHNYNISKGLFDMIFLHKHDIIEFKGVVGNEISLIRNWYTDDIYSAGEETLDKKTIIQQIKNGSSYKSIISSDDSGSEWFPDDY